VQVWDVKNPEVYLAVRSHILLLKEQLLANFELAWPRGETITGYISDVLLLGFFVLLVEKQS
jgi:uncharacterized membrane protein